MFQKLKLIIIPIFLGLALVAGIFQTTTPTQARPLNTSNNPTFTTPKPFGDMPTLGRAEDPVVISGTVVPLFLGEPITNLKAYAYNAGIWQPIPFQIDERTDNITGTYTIDDGILDANDELVFMGGDVGSVAPDDDWVNDDEARGNARYMLAVGDPLNAGNSGWVYLYNATTLTTSTESYVNWNFDTQTVTATNYIAGFSPDFVGLDRLEINNTGIDILDRQKIRVRSGFATINEESLTVFITPTVDISVIGPVRGVSNGGALNAAIYGSRLEFLAILDVSDLPIVLDEMRTSLDLNNPAVTTLNQYYDSNGGDFTIDGIPETATVSPTLTWYQASGTNGGVVVSLPDVNADGGTVQTYYKDDGSISPPDTGDQKSYADTGVFIQNPGNTIDFLLASYILPPNTDSNVGATYFDRLTTPLTATATAQAYNPGGNGNCTQDLEQDNGAFYRFCLPPGWEAGGPLMVYAHGYVWFNAPLEIPDSHVCFGEGANQACVDEIVNNFGIAFGVTSYPINGMAVLPAVDDVVRMVGVFSDTYGAPGATMIAGVSEGGLVTALAVERHPDVFHGGLAVCGPIGSWQEQVNYFGDFRPVFDYYFPGYFPHDTLPIPAQMIENWTNNNYFDNVIAPVIFDPANEEKLLNVLAAANVPHVPNDMETIRIAIEDVFGYNIMATNETMEKMGGNPFDNITRVYSGTTDDAALNDNIIRFSADMTATIEMQKYQTSGYLERPLISLHTSLDQQVPQWHEPLYQGLVNANHSWMFYVDHPMPTDNFGHCIVDVNSEVLPAFLTLNSMISNPPHRTLLNLPIITTAE